jgi:hypothetical protein
MRRATKDNIIHAHLNNKDIITLPEEKKSLINLAHLKPLVEQEPPQVAIPNTGACSSPYNAFLSLYTLWGNSALSKPGGCFTQTSSSRNPFKKPLFTSIWYNLNPLATEKARRILIAYKRATGANVSS